MRLTWRDAAATVLAALVVIVLLALTQAWSWPLLGDYRAGIVALAIIGVAMCAVGTRAADSAAFKQPFMILASVLGAGAIGLVVLGLIFATGAIFVGLGITILTLWALTTLDHAVPASPSRTLRTGA
jgi:hypothetical protein